MLIANCAHLAELLDRGAHGGWREPISQVVDYVIFAAGSFADETDDRFSDFVELEDSRAGYKVEKVPSCGLELVKFPRGQSNHAQLLEGYFDIHRRRRR